MLCLQRFASGIKFINKLYMHVYKKKYSTFTSRVHNQKHLEDVGLQDSVTFSNLNIRVWE